MARFRSPHSSRSRVDAVLIGLAALSLTIAHTAVVAQPAFAQTLITTDQFGSAGNDSADGVAAGFGGDVWVTGSADGTLSGEAIRGGGPGRFLRKYDSTGRARLTLGGDPDPAGGDPHNIAVAPDGGLFTAGTTWTVTPSYVDIQNGWVRSYSPGGGVRWTDLIGSQMCAIAPASDGGVVVASLFRRYHLNRTEFLRLAPGGDETTRSEVYSGDDTSARPQYLVTTGSGESYTIGGANSPLCPDVTWSDAWDYDPMFVRKSAADGTQLWVRQFLPDQGRGVPIQGAAALDDAIVVAADDSFYCLSATDGALRWRSKPAAIAAARQSGITISGVAIGNAGCPVVVGAETTQGAPGSAIHLWGLSPKTGAVFSETIVRTTGPTDARAVASVDGKVLVVGSTTGLLSDERERGGWDAYLMTVSGFPSPPPTGDASLVVDPPAPGGEQGWYLASPRMALVGHGFDIYFAFDGDTPAKYVGGYLRAAEGSHTLAYYGGPPDFAERRTALFKVDLTDPKVRIAGVSKGGVYEGVVRPMVTVEDTQSGPRGCECRLDGMPFAPGTAIRQAGSHTLTVEAHDKAGRVSWSSARFTLLGAAPARTGNLPGPPERPRDVLPAMGRPWLVPGTPRAHRTFLVRGWLRPVHPTGAAVLLSFYRKIGDADRPAVARTVRTAAGSTTYEMALRLGRGAYEVVASHADAGVVRAVSPAAHFRVR